MKIGLTQPSITQKEVDYVLDATKNSWGKNAEAYNKKFEIAFANYLNVKYAVALPSCTSAIHLALLALNIKKDDEVIVPDITWIGTSAPITYVGANTIFCDIDKKTWCMDVKSFQDSITENTKAIIPTDLYGNIPNMNKIIDIAHSHNIMVIEDAAEAIGSEYNNKKAGSLGDIGVFSFHASKTLTTGEGGMVVTNDKNIYDRVLFLRNHGRNIDDSKMFNNIEVAYKYKMSDLQAALGLAQLERIGELINKKQQIFNDYKSELKDLIKNKTISINYTQPFIKNTYWLVTIIINPLLNIHKKEIIDLMDSKGIDCRPFFNPLSSLPAYNKYNNYTKNKYINKNTNSYLTSPFGINLPSGFDMNGDKIKHVCKNLIEILNNKINNSKAI